VGLEWLQHQQRVGPLLDELPSSLPVEGATPWGAIEVATVTPWEEVEVATRLRPPCPPSAWNDAPRHGETEVMPKLVRKRGLEVHGALSPEKELAAAAHKMAGPLGPAEAAAAVHAACSPTVSPSRQSLQAEMPVTAKAPAVVKSAQTRKPGKTVCMPPCLASVACLESRN